MRDNFPNYHKSNMIKTSLITMAIASSNMKTVNRMPHL